MVTQKTITNLSQLDLTKQYSYADYLTWRFEDRVEILRGWVRKMSPAPTPLHQMVSKKLLIELDSKLQGLTCEIYQAPFDVRLKEGTSVVQPDLCIICNSEKIDQTGCNGAPDWIAEILSPGSLRKDLKEKYNLYAESGVKEYWIVDPGQESIECFWLSENGQYEATGAYNVFGEKTIPLAIFNGEISIEWEKIFPQQ